MASVALTLLDGGAEQPSCAQFERWLNAALAATGQPHSEPQELTIQIVDDTTSAELNQHYRGKPGATNVLSFPFSAPTPQPLPILGDLAICAPLVAREAIAQGKTIESHWAHLAIHGLLHLCGYDHIDDRDADAMESLEQQIMAELGYPDPYQTAPDRV